MGLRHPSLIVAVLLLAVEIPSPPFASPEAPQAVSVKPAAPSAQPLRITADRIEYLQNIEVYEADGSVEVVQGAMKMTADHMTIFMLTGTMLATGHVHLTDPISDVQAERLELDVNTDAGVLTDGRVYIKESTTLVTGRLLQRFSEYHYRAKDGSFTNCDTQGGKIPAWRFTFEDLDLNFGEGMYARKAWFCVNDIRLIPFPTMFYPIQTARKTGFLIPTAGYDNRFGLTYRQSFFWAINPSHDVTISPNYQSNLGYGSDVEWRYALDRLSRGKWLVSFLQQEKLPKVAGVDQTSANVRRLRGLLSGSHIQQVNPDLSIRAQAFLVSDPNYLQQLSNSGIQRAMPSGESFFNVNQRIANGNLYLLGQYLQPLQAGGKDTFQRLPEIGYQAINAAPLDGPLLFGLETTAANFYRDEGFKYNRINVMPAIGTNILDIGHVVGIRPQARFREVYYTRGITDEKPVHRETFWAAVEADSRLKRRFSLGETGTLLHTITPHVIYEYVPGTPQSNIIQVDNIDDLPKKNLITYSLNSRLLRQKPGSGTGNWLDLTIAQSYHPGSTPNQAINFVAPDLPIVGTITQPLQFPRVPVHTNKFSDIWTRAVIGNPVGILRTIDQVLTIDSFYDPYRGMFSQWNTDLRFQYEKEWYVEVGQRHTRDGNRPRRGDLWNPISFNEVYAPTQELTFLTLAAAFRGPFGTAFGAKTYYDLRSGTSPETDVVALYRNPCECWSVGFYFIQFPDRVQYNFMVSLAGIGTTENFGTQIMKYLLYPLLVGERALPWPAPYGKLSSTAVMSAPPSTRMEPTGP